MRDAWFRADPAYDAQIETRFLALHAAAQAHALDDWKNDPHGCLALVILLDQMPRNMFRGTPRAFESDAQALALSDEAVTRGFDRELLPVERMFLYMPYQHSEDLATQQRSLELFAKLEGEPSLKESIDYAHRHHDVIARFGRFPHRNAILGRVSTDAELEYLKQPGAGF
jgi:uncharacterized protein (DUF924 family)